MAGEHARAHDRPGARHSPRLPDPVCQVLPIRTGEPVKKTDLQSSANGSHHAPQYEQNEHVLRSWPRWHHSEGHE